MDTEQQAQLEVLRAEHKDAAVAFREQLQQAKQSLFALIKKPTVTESMKLSATRSVSFITEKIDLLTLNHFIKVRSICNATQQIKFDKIIEQVTEMISKAGEAPPPDGEQPPPPTHQDERPPPPTNN